MAELSRQQVVGLAAEAGLQLSQLATAGAICDAESGRRTDAVGYNYAFGVVISRDRGLWQINSLAHPDVSDACAFDPLCNARAMFSISNGGQDWHPWTTFNTGAYRQFLPAYEAILGRGVTPPPAPAFDPVGELVSKIERGYPFLKAVLEAMESVIGYVSQRSLGGQASTADLGSRFLH